MKEREHPVIDQVLALTERLQASAPDSPLSGADHRDLQAAHEIVDFLEEFPGGFLIYHAGGKKEVIYANQGLLRIFQCERIEEFMDLTGGSFRGMVHPEDLDVVEANIQQQLSAGRFDLDHAEYRVILKGGAVRWVEDYGHYVRDTSMGDVFYAFLADVTEKTVCQQARNARILRQKGAIEQEWRHRIEEYDRARGLVNQERLRRTEVIEGLGVNYESIFYVDLSQDKILPYRLSARAEAIFEMPFPMLDYSGCIRRYIQDWVHPEDRDFVDRETSPAQIRRRLNDAPSFYLNYRVVDQGKVQHFQARFVNAGLEGPPSQVVLGCRQVDENLRQELEQHQLLEEALHKAELAITAKNSFLSNMSHDMRTPLNAIFGFTALARNNLNNQEALSDYLGRIEASSHQLLDLIDKVLRLSWMDSHEVKAEEKPCRLGEILEEVYNFLLPQAQEKNIHFSLDHSRVRHDAIYGDQEKLSQLVMYLANNAVTYTPAHGCVTIIAAEMEELPRASSVYQITVRDTGIGIKEDFLNQLFIPFTRERNTTLSGIHGVGLGLTLAKNLADLLDGTIEVKSAVDKGSSFTVTLHLRTRPSEPALQEAKTSPSAESSPKHILLVDDNAINLEIETEILSSLGFQLDTAADGNAALEKILASSPGDYDLILMDIQMPVMDGWQAARAIRALPDPDLAGIPIVALSANIFDSDIQTSLNAGMDAHLGKPIDVPLLLRTIEKVLKRRQQAQPS